VATPTIRLSPFREGLNAVYFAGYDANKAPAHDNAWIYRSAAAIRRASPRLSTSRSRNSLQTKKILSGQKQRFQSAEHMHRIR
jgi:hypothetical protein